ncbi:cupin domain-containing protein [Metallumcola ferriviriculae]|uniref:Cupin domain-containing protein n=1 Tax=Metallumcola ferriviriculae TaxID=3039180 RepID=A0AAU0UQ20_9FIRM|nr:cupin domain-containing protein [Desulfitibacteraceae bacterium MK1]
MNGFLELNNIKDALLVAKRDEAVGIKIVRLTGNDTFAFYAAEIDGYKPVGAHYHTNGIEIYQIVEGQGEMYIGSPEADAHVAWRNPIVVTTGDCFTVKANQAHQLVNSRPERLIILFACPYSHISTDRIIVTGANG